MSFDRALARNVDPNNKAWLQDTTSFGYRMLLKMGWREGKGLGSKENGIKECIQVRKRRNLVGLGAENPANQWLASTKEYHNFLVNLSTALCQKSDHDNGDIENDNDKNLDKRVMKSVATSGTKAKDNKGIGTSSVHPCLPEKGKMTEQINFSSVGGETAEKNSVVPKHFIQSKVLRSKRTKNYSACDWQGILGSHFVTSSESETSSQHNNISSTTDDKFSKTQRTEGERFGVETFVASVNLHAYFKEKQRHNKTSTDKRQLATMSTDVKESDKKLKRPKKRKLVENYMNTAAEVSLQPQEDQIESQRHPSTQFVDSRREFGQPQKRRKTNDHNTLAKEYE
jgi:hypothetical protein